MNRRQCKGCVHSTNDRNGCSVFVLRPAFCWAHTTDRQKETRDMQMADYARFKAGERQKRSRTKMRRPNCGPEQPYAKVMDGKRYRDAVEKRLEEYGYEERMSPEKHQAATAIRKVIKIRYNVQFKPGGGMTKDSVDKAIAALDEILPPKGE